MKSTEEYALAIIENFVVRTKQERFRGFIESRRDDLLGELFIDERNLKLEVLIEVPRGKTASFVLEELRRSGATDDVYVISGDPDIDGRTAKLASLLEYIFDTHRGVLISCVNTRLGYYEDQETSKYILNAA